MAMLSAPFTVSFSRPSFVGCALLIEDKVYRSMAELAATAVTDWLRNLHPAHLPDPQPFTPTPQPRGPKVSTTSTPQASLRLPTWQLKALNAARPEARLQPLVREVVETWLENEHPDYKKRGESLLCTGVSRDPTPATADPLQARVESLQHQIIQLVAQVEALAKRVESLGRF